MGAWVYVRRCLTFGVKIKLKNIWDYAWGFFDVYIICSLYLAACIFGTISKFGPLPSKNPRCAHVCLQPFLNHGKVCETHIKLCHRAGFFGKQNFAAKMAQNEPVSIFAEHLSVFVHKISQ